MSDSVITGFTWRGLVFTQDEFGVLRDGENHYMVTYDPEHADYSAKLADRMFWAGNYGQTPEQALELCRGSGLEMLARLKEIFKDDEV